MTRREKLMHPATFISLAALFVALGGVGYAATKIGTKQLRNGAVTGPKLHKNSVTSPKIRAGAVRNGDLANNSVSTSKVRNGAIINADLALGSVLNGNLGNGAVTSEKIGAGAVVASKLAANSVTNPAIAPDSITAAQIANGQVVEGNGALSSVEVQLPNGALNSPILSLPGLGVLQANCAAGITTLEFVNNSGTSIDLREWGVVDGAAADTPIIASNIVPNGFFVEESSEPEGNMGLTWMASFGLGINLHLATINSSTALNAGGTCAISAQATYTS
jgi:hypothetical protein